MSTFFLHCKSVLTIYSWFSLLFLLLFSLHDCTLHTKDRQTNRRTKKIIQKCAKREPNFVTRSWIRYEFFSVFFKSLKKKIESFWGIWVDWKDLLLNNLKKQLFMSQSPPSLCRKKIYESRKDSYTPISQFTINNVFFANKKWQVENKITCANSFQNVCFRVIKFHNFLNIVSWYGSKRSCHKNAFKGILFLYTYILRPIK